MVRDCLRNSTWNDEGSLQDFDSGQCKGYRKTEVLGLNSSGNTILLR